MHASVFPLVLGENWLLLTAVVIGFFFGFALERGGFGNARKLAAQFYLNDMTVLKVMFTAIVVAMVGAYVLSAFRLLDLSMVWINPTFIWPQLVGGFVLGIGFIMSGLCPGTSVVSAASGRIDAMVTFGGIFLGVLLFTFAVDWVPGVYELYESGSLGVSTLPALLGAPPLWVAMGVVIMAVGAFLGAEVLERRFQEKRAPILLTPRMLGVTKWALGGAAAVVVMVGIGGSRPQPRPAHLHMDVLDAVPLARSIIAKDPNLMVLDVRPVTENDDEARPIPGAFRVGLDSTALPRLATADNDTRVVVYGAEGTIQVVPDSWPRRLAYSALKGGLEAWQSEVLEPVDVDGFALDDIDAANRHNQIAAYFSGATVQTTVAAPPPAMSGGAPPPKKKGGC